MREVGTLQVQNACLCTLFPRFMIHKYRQTAFHDHALCCVDKKNVSAADFNYKARRGVLSLHVPTPCVAHEMTKETHFTIRLGHVLYFSYHESRKDLTFRNGTKPVFVFFICKPDFANKRQKKITRLTHDCPPCLTGVLCTSIYIFSFAYSFT